MIIKNLFLTLLLVCSFNINAAVGTIGKAAIDFFGTPKGLDELFKSKNIHRPESISQLKSNVDFALDALSDSGNGSVEDLIELEARLVGNQDQAAYKKMMTTLQKVETEKKEVNAFELVEAINTLSQLSRKYAKQSFWNPDRRLTSGTCASCVNEELSELGLDFVVVEIKNVNKKFARVLKENMKSRPQMRKTIKSKLKTQGFGNFNRNAVTDLDLESLLYLSYVKDFGTPEEKLLAEQIKKVSKVGDGKYDIFDKSNGHAFFRLIISARTKEEKKMWIELLSETAADMDSSNNTTMDAFYAILQKRVDNEADAGKKSEKQGYLDYLRRNDCFSGKK